MFPKHAPLPVVVQRVAQRQVQTPPIPLHEGVLPRERGVVPEHRVLVEQVPEREAVQAIEDVGEVPEVPLFPLVLRPLKQVVEALLRLLPVLGGIQGVLPHEEAGDAQEGRRQEGPDDGAVLRGHGGGGDAAWCGSWRPERGRL